MQDYEDFLLEEQRNPNAAILEFFSKYDREDVVIMVEGDDDIEFYYDFIARYVGNQKFLFFSCSGKKSLLKFKSFLEGYDLRPAPKKILFLADKDFDDFLGIVPAEVFQTKYYSIENYFCDPSFFEYLLRRYTKGKIKNSLIPNLVQSFSQAYDEAAKSMRIPMAVLCSLREAGSEADFDLVSCHDILDVCTSTNSLKKNSTRNITLAKLDDREDLQINLSRVRLFAKRFSQMQPNYWLRGKYGLQLMRLVLRAIESSNPAHAEHLRRVQRYFGKDGLSLASNFLGEISELEDYCSL